MKKSIDNFSKNNNEKLKIKILKGILNKDELGKPFIEYITDITYNTHNWRVNKKFNQFANLHKTLKSLFKTGEFKLPDSSAMFNVPLNNESSNNFHENKIKLLEKYLNDISDIGAINKSKPFRKFFEFEEHVDDDNNRYSNEIEVINKNEFTLPCEVDEIFNSSLEEDVIKHTLKEDNIFESNISDTRIKNSFSPGRIKTLNADKEIKMNIKKSSGTNIIKVNTGKNIKSISVAKDKTESRLSEALTTKNKLNKINVKDMKEK